MKQERTTEQIAAQLAADRDRDGNTKRLYNPSGRKVYKAEADAHRGELLAADIMQHARNIRSITSTDRVQWNDLEDVQARTLKYFEACALAKTFPTVEGLAVQGFGISRQALNAYLLRHPHTDVVQYVEMVKDQMADILTNASLSNNASAPMAIFQLKNHYGYRDQLQLKPVQDRQEPDDAMNDEMIMRKYGAMVKDPMP